MVALRLHFLPYPPRVCDNSAMVPRERVLFEQNLLRLDSRQRRWRRRSHHWRLFLLVAAASPAPSATDLLSQSLNHLARAQLQQEVKATDVCHPPPRQGRPPAAAERFVLQHSEVELETHRKRHSDRSRRQAKTAVPPTPSAAMGAGSGAAAGAEDIDEVLPSSFVNSATAASPPSHAAHL